MVALVCRTALKELKMLPIWRAAPEELKVVPVCGGAPEELKVAPVCKAPPENPKLELICKGTPDEQKLGPVGMGTRKTAVLLLVCASFRAVPEIVDSDVSMQPMEALCTVAPPHTGLSRSVETPLENMLTG